jgi:hypothetical protein
MSKYRSSFIAALVAVLFIGICLFCLSSCDNGPKQEKIENVVRIFMHEPGHYSLMIQLSGSISATMRTVNLSGCEPKFIMDAPKDGEMWVYIEYPRLENDNRGIADFHIHSENDIDGGGWNHGKFGSGQTQVIR